MYKYIFFGVISIYKSISISDVEPFDSAKDFDEKVVSICDDNKFYQCNSWICS